MNWSALNGGDGQPARERIADDRGGLPIEKLTWPTAAHPVTLYRVIGGGHGWPGGPQYAPRFLVGRISRTFDATAAVLDFARKVSR